MTLAQWGIELQNAQVSDTTSADSSNEDHYIIINLFKELTPANWHLLISYLRQTSLLKTPQ
jgi:hypothetical protein